MPFLRCHERIGFVRIDLNSGYWLYSCTGLQLIRFPCFMLDTSFIKHIYFITFLSRLFRYSKECTGPLFCFDIESAFLLDIFLLGQYLDRIGIVFLAILLEAKRDMVISQDVSIGSVLYGQQCCYHEDNIAKHVRSQYSELFQFMCCMVLLDELKVFEARHTGCLSF